MNRSPHETEIVEVVDRVIRSRVFRRSPLMIAFLRYVVDETLAGRGTRISAYSVAVDALGKDIGFDPQTNPSVRVMAKRLRESLEKYYDEHTDETVQIEMTPGSYTPGFYYISRVRRTKSVKGILRELGPSTASGSEMTWSPPVYVFKDEHSANIDEDKDSSKAS